MLKIGIIGVLNEALFREQFVNEFSFYELNENAQLDPSASLDSADFACMLLHTDTIHSRPSLHKLIELRTYCELNFIPFVIITKQQNFELQELYADAVISAEDPFGEMTIRKLIERRLRVLDHILINPLTGAYNIRFLKHELQRQLNDMKRSHETFSVVSIELDHLESRSQHRAVFQALIDYIMSRVRPMDSLSHYGGHGLVLILPKTVKDDAFKLITRLLEQFSKQEIMTPDGAVSATFSCKVQEFVDANVVVEEVLDSLQLTESENVPEQRKGLIIDGSVSEHGSSTRKLKLAIIDDDRLIRDILMHQLSDIGGALYDVEIKTFADGEEFFQDAWHRQNERYLVLIDRVMPKMEGLEVLHRIRTEYDRRRYICFMISSKGAESDIALAIQRGANDYMVKPFNLKELRARIKRLIGGLR